MSSKYAILKFYEQALMYIFDAIGDRVTNNVQLDKLGSSLFGSDYLGSFSSNEFPKYIREGQCFILNTDSSRSNNIYGLWVSFIKINKKIYYYDSYARSPSQLSKYWKDKKLINANTTDRDQAYGGNKGESNCGQRSMAFLILIKKFGEKAINVV